MDPRPQEILTVDLTVDIDPTILLGLEFEKMRFVSQLDVESVLSESDNKVIETSYTPEDLENEDPQTSDTNSESDTEELTPDTELEGNRDINGNKETLSDYNLNRLFDELGLSDSDNEENDGETSPTLRERGGPYRNKSTGNQNRTDYLKRSDKYSQINRSQIDPRSLRFLSGSSCVQSSNASQYSALESNRSSTFNSNAVYYNVTTNEPVSGSFCVQSSNASEYYPLQQNNPSSAFNSNAVYHNVTRNEPVSGSSCEQSSNTSQYFPLENNHSSTFNSKAVYFNVTSSELASTSYPQFYEDSRANSIGSPESGYESSSTGSPPPLLPSTYINQELGLIPQLDDDQEFINYVTQDPEVCALTDRAAPKQLIDNGECKEKIINEILEFLKNSELVEVSSAEASCGRNNDIVPPAKSCEDVNDFAINPPPILKNAGGKPKKLGYKLKDDAKKELRRHLSQEKFWATEKKIFRRLSKDEEEKRPLKVIYVVDEKDKLSEIRTNLHDAVIKQNIEEIYLLVEIQKNYHLDLSDLNIRDKNGKTALDYAIQQHMPPAVIDYLKENTACQSVIV